jgi:hypothetical protein
LHLVSKRYDFGISQFGLGFHLHKLLLELRVGSVQATEMIKGSVNVSYMICPLKIPRHSIHT